MATLHWADITTIVVYFLLCLAVGLWSSRKTNQGNVDGYFLAGRSMTWLPIGASVFATNVGSQFFIGMAGSAAIGGIAVVIFEWHAVFSLMILGWIFLPVYIKAKVTTTPEYLQRRYGGQRLRLLLTLMSMFIYVAQRISVIIFSGGIFIQQTTGWNIYLSSAFIIATTTAYTIIGGLTAVIYTDAFQTVVMVAGSAVLSVLGLMEVGGLSGLMFQYQLSQPNVTTVNNVTCGLSRPDAWHIFRDPVTSDLPWPGLILGLTTGAVWVWCNDQVVVQRTLAAKSLTHARGGTILAAYLKLLPFLLIVIPGMISRVLFPDEVGCVDPDICERVCGSRVGCSNIAYPRLVLHILPTGVKGLMVSVILAALMSSLTSLFNSASSMFTVDIWQKVRHQASQRELMIVGRVFVLGLVVVSYLWLPLLVSSHGGQLWTYLQSLTAYLAPPWFVIFTLGVLWKRTTEKGAMAALGVGMAIGVTRMILDFLYQPPPCGEPDYRPEVVRRVHYLYFATISSLVCAAAAIAVSLVTEPRPEAQLVDVTLGAFYDSSVRAGESGKSNTGTSNGQLDASISSPEQPTPASDSGDIQLDNLCENGQSEHKKDSAKSDKIKPKKGAGKAVKRWLLYVLCGISDNQNEASAQTCALMEDTQAKHSSFWNFFTNANAIIVMGVTVFLLGVFH